MNKAKVLIVDDDAAVRDVLHDILESEGYEVTVVANAVAALKSGEQNNFDLLLADIKMPAMDGLELVRRFREISPQIVPVLITGYPDLETVTAAIEQGAYDYIVKPIDKKVLCTAVASALRNKLLTMERAKANIILREGADLTVELTEGEKENPRNSLIPAEVVATLRNSELFATLSDDELQIIADLCTEEIYKENEGICQQGQRSEKLYVIEEGTVALNRFVEPGRNAFITIDLLQKGRILGWSTLIEPHVHSVSVLCCKPTRILAINGAELRLILRQDLRLGFEVMQKLAVILANRLRMSYDAFGSKL